jgi:hypothetical protein
MEEEDAIESEAKIDAVVEDSQFRRLKKVKQQENSQVSSSGEDFNMATARSRRARRSKRTMGDDEDA